MRKEDTTCNLAQLVNLLEVKDDKEAKIDIIINQRELKGVVMDGGSGVKLIIEDTAKQSGLRWEPIAFNVSMGNNTTTMPKEIISNVKI